MHSKTHKPAAFMPGSGSGKNKRDSSMATPITGGGTKVIDRTKGGHLKRSKGSFKSY